MTEVVVWGRRPPPLGGVTRCVQGLSDALTAGGITHVVVDWRQRASLRYIVSVRRALHLHNVSSVWRLAFVITAKALSGAETIVYFHSGTLPAQLQSGLRRRLAQHAFRFVDDVWVTNQALAQVVAEVADVGATVVSPFSPTRHKYLQRGQPRERSAAIFVGYGEELYGLSTLLAAKRTVELEAWQFTVVAYGDEESCDRVRTDAEAAGCQVLMNLDARSVAAVLNEHEVLLRPTSADGDSMIVREALDAGRRVVASDVVPRPKGTELFDGSVRGFVSALTHGGVVSEGTGVGCPVSQQVVRTLSARALLP